MPKNNITSFKASFSILRWKTSAVVNLIKNRGFINGAKIDVDVSKQSWIRNTVQITVSAVDDRIVEVTRQEISKILGNQ